MKRFKKLISLFSIAALLVLFSNVNALHAKAATATTYIVNYVASIDEWRFQVGNSWDDSGYHRELYYLKTDIKEGDLLVVQGTGSLILDLTVGLSNITFTNIHSATITAPYVKDVYVLKNSMAAVNGDVTNAYVYDNAIANFNNNVSLMNVTSTNKVEASIAVVGTLDHLVVSTSEKALYDYYDFAANTFRMETGNIKTNATYFSTTPSTTPTTPTAPTTTSNDDEYDDVPKTGDSYLIYYLLGLSTLCLLGSYLFQVKKVKK